MIIVVVWKIKYVEKSGYDKYPILNPYFLNFLKED